MLKEVITNAEMRDPNNSKANTFKSYLDKINNNLRRRKMKILDTNGNIITRVEIQLDSSLPFISTPSNAIDSMKFFPVETVVGKYKDLIFQEDTVVAYTNEDFTLLEELGITGELSREVISNTSLESSAVTTYVNDRNLLRDGRYIELCSVTNPLTKATYSIFLDRKYKDLFMLPSLHLITSNDIKINPNIVLPIKCFSLGKIGSKASITETAHSLYDKRYFEPEKIFSIEEIEMDKTKLLDKLEQAKTSGELDSYGVSITKDTPTYIRDTMFPITYDKFNGFNGEIQVARQDNVPIIFIQLGKIKNILVDNPNVTENFVPNDIIFSNRPNFFKVIINDYYHTEDTLFSVAYQLY